MMQRISLIIFLVLALIPTSAHTAKTPASLIVTHARAMPPLSFIDETGEPAGLVVDLWTEWSRATGIPVSFRLVPWKETLDLVRTGQADIIGGLFFTPERAMKLDYAGGFLLYTASYFVSNDITIDDPQNERIEPLGVIAGDYAAHFVQDNYPEQPTRTFQDSDALIESLKTGSTAFFLMDTALAHWKLHKKGLSDRFSPIGVAYERELHPAVKRGRNRLVSTINAGMRKIPADTKQKIIRRWIPKRSAEEIQWWEIAAVISAFALMLGGVLLLTNIFSRKHQ